MAPRALDAQIDRLYQLPLDQFTAERNALAKEAGQDAARVRALAKPPIAAWAVNQLYWQKRGAWDALVAAAENARRAHKAVLAGRSGDVRSANQVHDEAVEAAVKATLGLLADTDNPATDATKQAITTTIRALPGEEPAGRLTRTLQPGGFEMLAGLSVAPGTGARPSKPAATRAESATAPPSRPTGDAKALTRAREAAAAASRALRDAEHAARREEFEIARTTREEERAEKTLDQAREALAQAKSELERAEAARTAAGRAREAAETHARDAERSLHAARSRADAAAKELKKIEKA
jgi:hypothetical protein